MSSFSERALRDGFHLRAVPLSRLKDLRADIEAFCDSQELNGFQEFIVSKYQFEPPELPFKARSVIIAAQKSYSYAEVTFRLNGRDYRVYAPSPADTRGGDTETYVKTALARDGYNVAAADFWFPFKRFAVQSGLAEYGRNNITYIPGLGSYASYAAFFSDMAPDPDTWRPAVTAKACDGCTLCREHCPTGAIREDRFLLNNIFCLSAVNEDGGEEFAPYVPAEIHHTTVNCLRCQYCCPMNADANKNTAPPVRFDETETALLLGPDPYETLPEALRRKCEPIGLAGIPGLKRNLRACFAIIDSGGACSLV
jgi:epoxyqueuosine reductase